jgi:hypothetical protein
MPHSHLPHPPCRCCLEPVHSFWQPNPFTAGGKVYVHCTMRGCPLYFATRELNDWLTMDLVQWNAVQHQRWTPPRNLLEVA